MSDIAIGLVLYPRLTALDIVGPYEVLSRLRQVAPGKGYRTVWIAETLEPVRADNGCTLVPEATFVSAPPLDIVVVPGGPGQTTQMGNAAMTAFLTRAAGEASIVVSVCTGSLLLAGAGLLEGMKAATHWLAREALAGLGAEPVADRVVRDGNVWTSAGVSAGIDLALALVAELEGPTAAQAIQLGIEYDPQPPFDAGSPESAPAPIVEAMRQATRAFFD